MKFIRKIFLIIFLIITLIYVTNITSIPRNIILFEGENLNLGTILGIKQIKEPIITTSSGNGESNIVYEEKIKLSLFNILNVKDVNVTTEKITNKFQSINRVEVDKFITTKDE